MTTQLPLTALLLLTTYSQMKAADIPIELDLTKTHHIEATTLPDGGYEIRTTGEDPYVMTRPIPRPYDPAIQYVFAFEYFCMSGLDGIELFYGPPIKAHQSASGPELLSSEGWTQYSLNILTHQEKASWRAGYQQFRLDFGRRGGKTIQLRNIVLRMPNSTETADARDADKERDATATFDAKLRSTVRAQYEGRVARVTATEEKIRITIARSAGADELLLCEVPFYQSFLNRDEFVWQQPLTPRKGEQTIELERRRGDHDRVFSSWILMRKTDDGMKPASHPHFVDSIPPRWTLTRDKPLSRKGTVGLHGGNTFQIRDYQALGIHNATKNIVLPSLVKAEPFEGASAHEFNGTKVYINADALQGLDRAMKEMDELKIVVSAIILIPKDNPMAHPDCAPQGIYAMANVVEKKGWHVYAAGLDFLAQRYMRPDRKYGRITHWILHNEVDAAWVWTNAGEKPLHTYLDLFYRSMRTAQSVIRRYGDAGCVLVSLTHYWTKRHNSRCYPPKALVDLLGTRSRQEGDFDWGLAYHPYPQNLRDPRTWLDKEVTFNFNTPLITPKNLEVLDAYMRQSQMLHEGKVRTIVLSEQGSNSPDHSDKSYRDQSAGLAYTWLKVEALDSIESYIHHRWKDHPREGGLNLGLRRDVPDDDPEQGKKPVWEIYRQLGTPEQPRVMDWLQTVVPAEYLKNIPARVESMAVMHQGMSFLDNGQIRLGANLDIGGSITHLSAGDGPNMINSHDWGRQIQMSFYSGPKPFEPDGKKPRPSWAGLGWNPIQSGDCYGNRSEVLEHRNNGKEIYVKCRPMHWPLNDHPGQCTFECWYRLDGNRVHVRSRLVNTRDDKIQYEARTQELPAVYTNGKWFKLVTYQGEQPFSGAAPRVLVNKDDGKGWPWRNFYSPEHWVALLDDDDNGLGLYHPGVCGFTGGFAGQGKGSGGPKSSQTGYMGATIREVLDHNIAYSYEYTLIAGSLKEIRDYVYDAEKERRLPKWDFTRDRQHWTCRNITDEGWPIDAGLRFKLGPKDAILIGPKTFWRAEDAPTLVLSASFTTAPGATAELLLQPYDSFADGDWAQWGPEKVKRPTPAKPVVVPFKVAGDGKMHTTEIDLSAWPAYQGGMTQVKLRLPDTEGTAIIQAVELRRQAAGIHGD